MEILNVTIVRNSGHMHREVLDCELPVILQTHGDMAVQVVGERKATKEELASMLRRPLAEDGETLDMSRSDVELAWDQLNARYNSEGSPKDAAEAFKQVYPTFHQFKRSFGKSVN